MEFSEFVFGLLLLFLPGIICAYIVDTFTIHKERTQFQFVINSYLLGMIAYFTCWVVIEFCRYVGFNMDRVMFLNALVSKGQPISFGEIVWACITAILLAILFIWVDKHKWHFKIFKKFGITNKIGELDVWGYLMNAKETEWVTVRDIENNLMYDGSVVAFSDNNKEAEILLANVGIYENDSAHLLYEVDAQYLSLSKDKIVIEVQKRRNRKQ